MSRSSTEKGPALVPPAEVKAFCLYPYDEVKCSDVSLEPYVSLGEVALPHSHARHGNKQFAKAKVNIIERLANKLMRGGTGEKLGGRVIRTKGHGLMGKKSKALRVIMGAFAQVKKRTGQNPLQVLVNAVEHSAPREDITRVRFGGISYQVAVDVSPLRRLDLALRNLTLAAIMGSFDKKVTLSEALANELVLASSNDISSYAVKRRNDGERMAKSAR